ncbi:hypothetical protein Dsin_002777 [Dipteronia sinensis]|uniref:Uncharacterized protein n=1 Tax=Dipteronia sinensis TaxID=43782 RepID=A0AAE0B6U1_9ROSI|nr:hypothetical protein Dsin_002777 [Dipteronia sinensis]
MHASFTLTDLLWIMGFTQASFTHGSKRVYLVREIKDVIFTCLAYLIPLFAVVSAVSVDQTQWVQGFHDAAAKIIAGKWLKFWIEIGDVMSGFGYFEAQLSSYAYHLKIYLA